MGGQWRLGAVISCERQRGLSPESASVQIKTSNCRHLYKQCIEDTLDLCYWKQTNTHRHSLFQHYPLLGQEFLCWKYTLERNRANSGPILRTSNPVPHPMRSRDDRNWTERKSCLTPSCCSSISISSPKYYQSDSCHNNMGKSMTSHQTQFESYQMHWLCVVCIQMLPHKNTTSRLQ